MHMTLCRKSTISSRACSTKSLMSKPRLHLSERIEEKLSFLKAKFYFKHDDVQVLERPSQFYETLKDKISSAQDRIFLASLYVGRRETELIDCIDRALAKNPALQVHFLVDGLRGTREAPNPCSASLLAQLMKKHGNRIDIRLYVTPSLIGWKKWLLPRRFNEGIGLQHMKIYGFDDEVMLSGANLSEDYFTNRQDRYILYKSKIFADYYFKLHQLISRLSYQVQYRENARNFSMTWPRNNFAVDPTINRSAFIAQSSNVLKEFLNKEWPQRHHYPEHEYPTVVYPVSQFTPLFKSKEDHSTEKPGILALLSAMDSLKNKWVFTAGYFNILPEIEARLLSSPSVSGKVITAAAQANSFYKSRGVSKYIPDAYAYLAKQFLERVEQSQKASAITLNEWSKGIVNTPGGWSYHAKGIWISDGNNNDFMPCVTVVGSSNYTRRAYSLDIESSVITVTRDEALKRALHSEVKNLMSNTQQLNLQDLVDRTDGRTKLGVRIATEILGKNL